MTDRAVQFGHLAGILSAPVGNPRGLCILVNAGLVPKLGPFRLYVELARHLARDGIATLRFDLGGIGDSRQELPGMTLRERTFVELTAAVDELQRHYPDVKHLVVGGLCSGAEDSLRFAERDLRVTGALLIDPFAYRTEGHEWRHLAYRATRRALRAAGLYEPLEARRGLVQYKYMEYEESSRILKAMIARDARVHFIYTGAQQQTFNHAGQLQKMFPDLPLAGHVTVDYLPHLEHTQFLEEDRRAMVSAIGNRLR